MITVQNLRFRYPGASAPTLHGLDFAIEPGEIFGFLGPSGAGKSTTQNILIRLLAGYEGSVNVLGKPLAAWGADYYEHVGVSFELPTHFRKLTALENLRYFGALYRRPTLELHAVLELVGLEEAANVRVAHFSKGMQQRLSVARALLHRPELLFLDEPTSGLDPVNARRIKTVLREQQASGTTIVLATHNMAIAEELCDRVAFLVDGANRLIDTPRALKLRYGSATVKVEAATHDGAAPRCFPLPGLADNAAFLELLRSGTVQTIHTQEASLDDIFVQVTGRQLI